MRHDIHWASIVEGGMVMGMHTMYFIHRCLGRWPFRIFMLPVMGYYFLVRGIARRSSLEYLRRIEDSTRGITLYWISFRHFLAFGECILDKALAWSGQLPLSNLKINGLDALKKQLATGQGAMLLVSHLGNMEISRALARLEPDIKLTVLVHTKHARLFNKFLRTLNQESQADLIQVTEISAATAIMLAERLKRGELIVIAADRVPVSGDPRVVFTPFLGREAPFPIGPFVLASLLKCPVFLLFSLKLADGYHLSFEYFTGSLHLPRSTRDAALRETAARFAQRLEHYCRMAPLQWFNFFPFWSQVKAP